MKRVCALALVMSMVPALAQKIPVFDTNLEKPIKQRAEKFLRELFSNPMEIQKNFEVLVTDLTVRRTYGVNDMEPGMQMISDQRQQSLTALENEPGYYVTVELFGATQRIFGIFRLYPSDRENINQRLPGAMLPFRKLVAIAYNGSRFQLAAKKLDRGNDEFKRQYSELYEYLQVEASNPTIAREEVVLVPGNEMRKSEIESFADGTLMEENRRAQAEANVKPWYVKEKVSDDNIDEMKASYRLFVGDKDLDEDGQADVILYEANALSLESRKDYGRTEYGHKSTKILIGFKKEGRKFSNSECLDIPTNNGPFCGKGVAGWRPVYTDLNSAQMVLVRAPGACGFTHAKSFLVLETPAASSVILIYGVLKYQTLDRVGVEEKPLTPDQKKCLLEQPNNEILSMLVDRRAGSR